MCASAAFGDQHECHGDACVAVGVCILAPTSIPVQGLFEDGETAAEAAVRSPLSVVIAFQERVNMLEQPQKPRRAFGNIDVQ